MNPSTSPPPHAAAVENFSAAQRALGRHPRGYRYAHRLHLEPFGNQRGT